MVRACRAEVESEYERRAEGIILETLRKVAEVSKRKILPFERVGDGWEGRRRGKGRSDELENDDPPPSAFL